MVCLNKVTIYNDIYLNWFQSIEVNGQICVLSGPGDCCFSKSGNTKCCYPAGRACLDS